MRNDRRQSRHHHGDDPHPTAMYTVTTSTLTTNAVLPMLEGSPGLLQLIAEFAGVVVGKKLRCMRAIGPAIAAVHWQLHDEARA